jgi:hypothetical protein
MPNYLFTYRLTQQAADAPIRAVADKEFSLTTDDEAMAAWGAFFEENGSVFIDPGMPVFERTSVGEVGPSTVLGGFSVVEAVDLDGAVALATKCPTLHQGGGVEVGLLTVLGADNPAEKLRNGVAEE